MATREEKDLEKLQKMKDNRREEESKGFEAKIEAQIKQTKAPEFLRSFPKHVDEATDLLKKEYANADANIEGYQNATRKSNPDRDAGINVKNPGEVDGKADDSVELKDAENERVASKLPKPKPPGSP